MIIEFFGVPGGGKSTLLREMLRHMPDAREIKLTSRKDVVKGVVRFLLRHPVSFFTWTLELVFNARGLFRYKVVLLMHSMAVRAAAERLPLSQIVFIDEGMTQRILSLFEVPLGKKHISFLLRKTPMPDMCINVQGGEFGRFTSAPDRLGSPRVRRGQEKLEKWMQVVRTNASQIEALIPLYTHVIAGVQNEESLSPQNILLQLKKLQQ